MSGRTSAFLQQLRGFWAELPTPKRLALVIGTGLVLVSVLVIVLLGSRVSYGYLFTELDPKDASAIVEELKKRNVPHRLEAGGTAIMVPEEQRHALRLELAADGLPRGGSVGFELFDRAQIGATEFEQHVSLRRALEGELSRSIASVEGVASARVHLVMPERRLFAMRDEAASASVVVKLRNPGVFGRREVAGIVHLVATGVPGLSRERVSVVSTEGVTLHRPSSGVSGGSIDGSDARAEQEREVASRLEREVQEQLERVVGPGNADVRINITLDAAVTERVEEYWDRDTTALRSEHIVEEGLGSTEAGVAGVPGARANLPDAAGDEQAPMEPVAVADGAGSRRSRTRNWEVDRITEKTSLPPGGVRRLSVAVLLNGRYDGEGSAARFIPRSKEEVQALEQVVKRAVGYDEQRGDSVLVQAAQFARPVYDAGGVEPLEPWWKGYLPYAAYVAAAVVLLLVLLITVLVWRTRSKSKQKARELAQAQQVIRQLEEQKTQPALSGPATHNLLQPPAEDPMREVALRLAAEDPATAAVVLKKWLATEGPAP